MNDDSNKPIQGQPFHPNRAQRRRMKHMQRVQQKKVPKKTSNMQAFENELRDALLLFDPPVRMNALMRHETDGNKAWFIAHTDDGFKPVLVPAPIGMRSKQYAELVHALFVKHIQTELVMKQLREGP